MLCLVAVLSTANMDRLRETLVPLLQEPEEVLTGKLVPLISSCDHPEHLGLIINHAEIRVLLWIIRDVELSHLLNLMKVLEPTDLQAGGALFGFLEHAADDPDFVDQKLLPLLRQGNPETIMPFLRGLSVEQLVVTLRTIDSEGVLRLLSNFNPELAIKLCSGPHAHTELAQVLRLHAIVGLAAATQNPIAAKLVKHGTSFVNTGISEVTAKVASMMMSSQEI